MMFRLKINILTIFLLINSSILICGETSKPNIETTKTKPEETAPAKNTTVTEKPKVPNTLCTSCDCNSKSKTFDCSNRHLQKLFTLKDWLSLNESGIAVDIMILSGNGIDNLTQFPPLDVKKLDLSYNNIDTIENNAFQDLKSLEELNLSNNKLSSKSLTPTVFQGRFSADLYEPIKELKILNLGGNLLHTLHPDIFEHFPKLEVLILESNPFKAIDVGTESAIAGIYTLRSLDLSYMELSKLPEHIFHSPSGLQVLNLTGNLLTEVPNSLSYARNLKQLILDENPMRNFTDKNVFPEMKSLEYLSLSYIHTLQEIGKGAFSGLTNLREMHLDNNYALSKIDELAFAHADPENPERKDWPPVKKLYLHNDKLEYLHPHLLARWDDMETIDIRSNPWSCDCDNQWMLIALLPIIEEKTSKSLPYIKCASPEEFRGKNFTELEEEHTHLRCRDYYGNNPRRDSAILIGLLIGFCIGIPLTLAALFLYKRGCFGLIGNRGPADYSRAFYKRASNDDFHI
uniref:Putative integral to membrane n=1 Tax=Corethrella appendiculata TaxID=1370023 RepID=U5EN60_9DIPT